MRAFGSFALLVSVFATLAPQSSQMNQEPALKPGQISFAITTNSMAPTLIHGDLVASDVLYYQTHVPSRGDLIVLEVPSDKEIPQNVISVQSDLVKRVVAVGGDVILLSKKTLRVNGVDIAEPYAHYEPVGGVVESGDFGPTKVPSGHYFVLGDNRSHSLDSRAFGTVAADAIIGKPLYIVDSTEKNRIGRELR
jgi:signal peptidase I